MPISYSSLLARISLALLLPNCSRMGEVTVHGIRAGSGSRDTVLRHEELNPRGENRTQGRLLAPGRRTQNGRDEDGILNVIAKSGAVGKMRISGLLAKRTNLG